MSLKLLRVYDRSLLHLPQDCFELGLLMVACGKLFPDRSVIILDDIIRVYYIATVLAWYILQRQITIHVTYYVSMNNFETCVAAVTFRVIFTLDFLFRCNMQPGCTDR